MRTLLVLMALAACGGKATPDTTPASNAKAEQPTPAVDDCQRYVDKTRPIFEEMAAGQPLPPEDTARFLEMCRAQAPAERSALITCVLDAADQPAVRECFGFRDSTYTREAKRTPTEDVRLKLDKLGKNLKTVYTTTAQFPIGTGAQMPPQDCCLGPNKQCPAVEFAATPPMWSEQLDFYLLEPGHFRYSYASDGKTATVTATGDLDCDGRTITYTLEASVSGGNPQVTITEPPPNTD